MLAEIIREVTKAEESTAITSEEVLIWHKRVEAQRAQSTIINSLSKRKEFGKDKDNKRGTETKLRKLQTPAKQSCSCCGFSHPPRQCPAYGKESVARSTTLERFADV